MTTQSTSRFENADGQWWEIDMDPNERTVRYSLPEGVTLTRNATSLELHLVEMIGKMAAALR